MHTLAELRHDLIYGARLLAKSPGFAAVAVLSLALGIGANTAIFTLINTVLLKLLPVHDPQALVSLTDPNTAGVSIGTSDGTREMLSTREFESLRDRTQVFSGVLAAQSELDKYPASINGQPPEDIRTRLVSGGYFSVLGTTPFAGRFFTAADEHGPATAPFAVISYEFWLRRFGGAPSALQARIHLFKADLSVIGVAPPHFFGEHVGAAPDIWIPLDMQPLLMPGRMWLADDPARIEKVMWLHVIGRRKPGVSEKQAEANVNVVFKQIVAEEFAKYASSQPSILKQDLKLHFAGNGVSTLRGDYADPLYFLMAVVGLVLLIACANLANLLLARATARQKEMSVRLALGAGRARIIRQFLTESLMLSIAGGVLGSLFAVYGVGLLTRLVSNHPGEMMLDIRPDLRVLLFTIGISLLTGFVFGLAPAWRSAGINVSGTLKEAGRGLTANSRKVSLGKLLVVAQIVMSVMLLIGAGWFVRTLRNLENVDLGYQRDKLVLMHLDFLTAGYSGERLPIAYNEVRERLARIPGVRAVAYSTNGLFSGSESSDEITVEGYKPTKPADKEARFDRVGPDYFKSIGIPILLGRDISAHDTNAAESVCVVNEAFAKFYFNGQNPIGRHITDEFPDTKKTFTIVGVTRNARDHSLRRDIDRRFYLSALQPLGQYAAFMNYEIRTLGDPASIIQPARREVLAFDPAIPIYNAKPFVTMLDEALRQSSMVAELAAAFGGLALLLACIGLYGVLSYAVAQRTNEIGIRMALGAERTTVVRMILRETALLILVGLAVGVPASLACARLIQSKLFGLKPADPLTLATALAIMIAVAIASGYLPARRASRVDPLVALRYE